MIAASQEITIRCYTGLPVGTGSDSLSAEVEVFFARTGDLIQYYPLFMKLISHKEFSRAERFFSERERETYITCHALLRLILSVKMNISPDKLSYERGGYNKPGLPGDPLFFNISHTRKAFALGISANGTLGLDIEDMDRRVDITSVSGSYFSRKELDFTMSTEAGQKERFFMVWTRKEALLKAMGTGIIDDLNSIEVSDEENYVNADLFRKKYCQSSISDYFLYSKIIDGHYLSLALPFPQSIIFKQLDSMNIKSYLD